MPQGDKSKYTEKQERKADHIAEGYEERGISEKEAERRAWATVNKDDGGGVGPGGSGRGQHTGHPAAHKGGEMGGRASAGRSSAEPLSVCQKGSGNAQRAGLTRKVRRADGPQSLSEHAMSNSTFPLPIFRPPQLATLERRVPTDDCWLFEMKFDGYRMQAAISGQEVRLYARNGHNWTHQFGFVVPALAKLTKGSALIEGELCAIDDAGAPTSRSSKTASMAKRP